MGATWHKPHYVKADYDRIAGDLLPVTLAPGLYVEDEATLDKILASTRKDCQQLCG